MSSINDKDIALLKQILTGRSVPVLSEEDGGERGAELTGVCSDLITIRQTLEKFSKGHFEEDIMIRGAVAGSLKTLQANLRHLAWQVQQVAAGDFTQRVEFMGEFSEAFNSMVVQLDVTIQKLKKTEEQLTQQAMYDALTGLPNRNLLRDHLDHYVASSLRSNEPFIYAILDLDCFKSVNDTYGHLAGDVVLKEFGRKISFCLRETDTAARIGGDEFIFICTCRKGEERETVKILMERLYRLLEEPVHLEKAEYQIGSSIGICFFPQHANNLSTLFKKADEALYRSKEKGKNTYTIWGE